jgi:hypothetical protein
MGAPDPQGIHIYDETDARDTFSALLNIGQESTSDQFVADRGRLAALEANNELSAVSTAGIFTSASGWAIIAQQGRKQNGLAFVRIIVERTGGTITVNSTGDITNQTLADFAAGWQPVDGMDYLMASASVGRVISAVVRPGTGVLLAGVTPGANIVNTDQISLTGIYPLA